MPSQSIHSEARLLISKSSHKYLLCFLLMSFLAACGGGGSTTPTPPAGPITSTLSGTVLSTNNTPLAGVTISVYHHNDHTTATAITDSNGHYAVPGLSTGTNADYEIYADKTGYGFYPKVSDAAGEVNKFDFNGLYRTVARFITLPAHDVSGVDFTAYAPGDKVASLPRTGQTFSYVSGDDAATHTGVTWPTTRFVDNLDGTVSDQLTGLLWLKNAGCFSAMDWASAMAAANALTSGSCGLSDGSAAGQWRVPNANELESLVDVSQSNPAVSATSPFTNIDLGHAYWSSTTYTALNSNAFAIRFSDGRWINGIDSGDSGFNNNKTTALNGLWAVKSGSTGAVQVLATGAYSGQGGSSFAAGDDASLQLGAPLTSMRFVDQGDGTIVDTVTGLTWLKKADCIHDTWGNAITTINNLSSGQCGLSDGSSAGQWRMPNRQEMLSIADRAPTFPLASYFNGQYQGTSTINGPVIFDTFIVSDYYWTSTTNTANPTQAWTLYSCDFGVYNIDKTALRYALAVR